MEKCFLLLMLSFSLLVLPVFAISNELDIENPKAGKYVLRVHGLACPFCVIGLKKTLKKIKGVKSVKVSLKYKTVTLYTTKGICFSDGEMKKIFGKAGFSFHGMSKPEGC